MSRITASASVLFAVLSTTAVNAAELEVYKFLEAGVTATDNFRFNEADEEEASAGEEEEVYSVTPSVELIFNGNRFANELKADVSFVRFGRDKSNVIDPRIELKTRGSVVDNWLYLRSGLRFGKMLTRDDFFSLTEDTESRLDFSFRPYLSHSFGRIADLNVDYNHLTTDFETDGKLDRHQDNLSFSFGRNPKYGGLIWGFGGTYENDRSDDFEIDTASAFVSLGATVGQTVFFQVQGGEETNNFAELLEADEQTSTWEASLSWRPTARTSWRLAYGDRFFGEGPTLGFEHRGQRTLMTLQLARGIATSDIAIGEISPFDNEANDTVVQPDDLDLADELQTDVPFVEKRLTLGYKITGRRSDIVFDATYSTQEELAGDATRDAFLGRFVFDRQLGPLTTLRLQYNYIAEEEGTAEREDEHRVGFRFIYNFDLKARTSILEDNVSE